MRAYVCMYVYVEINIDSNYTSLQMILSNAMCAMSQALDLRWLEVKVRSKVTELMDRHGIVMPTNKIVGVPAPTGVDLWGFVPWYDAAYCPRRIAGLILDNQVSTSNRINKDKFVNEFSTEMERLTSDLSSGKYIQEVADASGEGREFIGLTFIQMRLTVEF